MLLNYKKNIAGCCIALTIISCSTLHKTTGETKNATKQNTGNQTMVLNEAGLPESTTWNQAINGAGTDVKTYFTSVVDGRWDFFKKYNVDLTEKDVPGLKLIPATVYKVDSVALFNFNSNSVMSNTLKLDTTRATFYAVKSGQVVTAINAGHKNNKWYNAGGYAIVDPKMGELVAKANAGNQPIFEIQVQAFPSQKRLFKGYLVYYDGSRLMTITQGETKPLKEELQKAKALAIQIDQDNKNGNHILR